MMLYCQCILNYLFSVKAITNIKYTVCTFAFIVADAPIRLTGGTNELEGRVEIMFEGIWGTICDSGWDDIDATIVCRELGYVNGAATRQAQFGTGSGILWLNHVGCLGTENKLSHCMHNGVGNIGSCSHAQDAGVICNTAIGLFSFI